LKRFEKNLEKAGEQRILKTETIKGCLSRRILEDTQRMSEQRILDAKNMDAKNLGFAWTRRILDTESLDTEDIEQGECHSI
jgi:hypothetical protein